MAFFQTSSGDNIFYESSYHDNDLPAVVFLHGLGSDICGYKASRIQEFCVRESISLLMFDNFAHGKSSGKLEDMTVSKCLEIIDELSDHLLPKKKLILVGSSMGGGLAFCFAYNNPDNIAACLGIAPAVDFTELIFSNMSGEQKKQIVEEGQTMISVGQGLDASKYLIGYELVREGREHLLLDKDIIEISCPVRIVHGIDDVTVPYNNSLYLIDKLSSTNAHLVLIKDGDHTLHQDTEIKVILEQLHTLIDMK